jgi:hypothetical protein
MINLFDLENSVISNTRANRNRIVRAPSPQGPVSPPAVLTIELDEDEEVQWHWTHFADGRSIVTGYPIIRSVRLPEASVADSQPRKSESCQEASR